MELHTVKVFLRFSALLLALAVFLHVGYGDQPNKLASSTGAPQFKRPWKLARCGLPAWFFDGGVLHLVAGRRRSVGTAYGHPVYISEEPGEEAAARIARTAQALIECARGHYAPMASLCHGNLLSRLNAYCRWSSWSPDDPKGRAILPGVRILSAILRSIRAQYQKHPLTAADITRIRSKIQGAVRLHKYYAQMSRDVFRLEYPTIAAINWRIGTFKKWPNATAMLWEDGLFRMQCTVAPGRPLFPKRPGKFLPRFAQPTRGPRHPECLDKQKPNLGPLPPCRGGKDDAHEAAHLAPPDLTSSASLLRSRAASRNSVSTLPSHHIPTKASTIIAACRTERYTQSGIA